MTDSIDYQLKRGTKTKRLSISIHSDLRVVVSAPLKMPERTISHFVAQKRAWIEKSLNYYQSQAKKIKDFELDDKKRKIIKEYIESRIELINKHYNFSYKKVFVKKHKSRWGSCSVAGNLNFNYRIVCLPQRLGDYIIAHELCHLGEMNHSKKFWNLVEKSIPDHRQRRRDLKKIIF